MYGISPLYSVNSSLGSLEPASECSSAFPGPQPSQVTWSASPLFFLPPFRLLQVRFFCLFALSVSFLPPSLFSPLSLLLLLLLRCLITYSTSFFSFSYSSSLIFFLFHYFFNLISFFCFYCIIALSCFFLLRCYFILSFPFSLPLSFSSPFLNFDDVDFFS